MSLKQQICIFLSIFLFLIILSMRKDELQLLDNIDKLAVSQIYLLDTPRTPQQEFLHLFAHRTLVARNMFHRNLDRVRPRLKGSFAQAALQTSVVGCLVENQVDCSDDQSLLMKLVERWVNYYPSLRNSKRDRYILADIVLQGEMDSSAFGGLANYLAYLDMISLDLWRLIRGNKSVEQFTANQPLRGELQQMLIDRCGQRFDANDLLTFISGCIPKTLLNIIMANETLPNSLKKRKNFECLYVNNSVQYFLRRNTKLGLLLRQIIMLLVTMQLREIQQKFLMLVTMRYFYVFHFDRRYSAAEILIHVFNKLSEQTKKALSDQFALFFRIAIKLGKTKFTNFVAQNSAFARKIIEMVQRKPTIGYPQDSANPYSTAGVAEVIDIESGSTVTRTFEVLQDYSIFYFRIQVLALDVTVKLYYLGEVGSSKQMKKLLLTHEKVSGEMKNSINAVRRGLYCFQFDNSTSWINRKRLTYENEVFSPLQIKSSAGDEWIDDFYGNIFMNEIHNGEEEVVVIEKAKIDRNSEKNERQVERREEGQSGVANIERNGNFMRVVVRRGKSDYSYETDNQQRMVQKAQKISSSKENYRWQIQGRTTQSLKEVEAYIRKEALPEGMKQQPQKELIGEFIQDENEETEYEVVQRADLQRSQIINQSLGTTPRGEAQSFSKSSKQTIDASLYELNEAS